MSGETVKVIVRCRPINGRERDLNSEVVVDMTQGVNCLLMNPAEPNGSPKSFTFDGAYFVDSTTEQIYNDVGFGLVESVLEGYNGTVFAYGQTGCGKSFSMQGITDPATQRGIIPRSFEHIFEVIQTSEDMKYLVNASYLEIYNEEVRDLLGVEVKKKLDLKEHPEKGVYVAGLSLHSVHNTQECEMLMNKGWANRSTGATLMNAESSRSHSIFTISLEMMSTAGGDDDAIRSGKLNLVDLAGSERLAKTGATGDRQKEAAKINLSLSALGNVISALVDGKNKTKFVPYRDSKLTRLLQDSLGGNTKTLMVACLSPADNNYDESLSTLRYANRAKNIKNKPKINEDPKDAMLREYQDEIRKLKDMLDTQGPMKSGMNMYPGKHKVVSVAPDEKALEHEREKVRREFEEQMKKMKEDMVAERENNALLQAEMDSVRKKYEEELTIVNKKIEEKTELRRQASQQQLLLELPHQKKYATSSSGTTMDLETDPDDPYAMVFEDIDEDFDNAPTTSSVKTQNAEMMTSMQELALKRLKEIQTQMVGGEKSQDKELKAKRTKRKKYLEKRKKILSEALKTVDDEDGIMIKVYDDIHEELKAKTDLAKKQKQRIKSMDQEVKDLSQEFQNERTDYLETIRKQDQQVKLLQAIIEKVQPTIRKDCNYTDLDSIKKDAYWDDEYLRWKVPDLTVVKTKLPPAGPISTQANSSDLLTKYNQFNNNMSNSNNQFLQAAMRNPSQTAPARLGMWDDDDQNDDKMLKQKLQKGAEEDIVGSYFKPKRTKELLNKYKGDSSSLPDRTKKFSNSNNLNMSMSQTMLGTLNLNSTYNNSSFNATQGPSNNSTWDTSASGGNSGQNNMLRDNGFASSNISPDTSLRRPNRLEALPSVGQRSNKKKSRDVLHTLDLI